MSIAVENTISHYKILSPLGAGGMGEVFLAEDTELERKVAIKFLNKEFNCDIYHLDRFRREAKAASALNHPNILTIYEIGTSDDRHFIATEYIDGQTLREKISEGSLSLAEIIHLAVQTVEALSAAHKAGIIHRDIKPENIMVRRDGYVKILDFGLAKLFDTNSGEIDAEAETRKLVDSNPGVVMGTAKYMSPEQARGKQLDARTDIFSFGVVLYEMISGRCPFQRETVADIVAAVLHQEPKPLTDLVPDIPKELEQIVSRSFHKSRENRYQTTAELLDDLKNLREKLTLEARAKRNVESVQSSILPIISDGAGDLRESVLVTDFVNLTGDAVFDGTLSMALTFTLQQSPALDVYADERIRETLRLMGRAADSKVTGELGREICLRQGLKAYITASIASLGKIYVLTLEAFNAQTGETIGREFEQAETKELVLTALGKAASGLREKLGESLSSIEKFPALCDRTTSSLEALKIYSMGYEHVEAGKYYEAISFFKKAIEIDPDFAIAYINLAAICANINQPKEAAKYGRKAFELKERVSELEKLRITDFYYTFFTGEIDKSIETLKLFKLSYPRRPRSYLSLSDRYQRLGQFEKAVEEAREAIRISPNVFTGYLNLAEPLISLNRFAEAEEVLEKATGKNLDTIFSHLRLYGMAFIRGDKKGLAEHLDWIKEEGKEHTVLDLQAQTAACLGEWNKAKDFSRRAVSLALSDNLKAVAAQYLAEQALRIALLEFDEEASSINESSKTELNSHIERSLELEKNQNTLSRTALAIAFAGSSEEAENLIDELKSEYPKDTLINQIWIPTIEGAIALRKDDPSEALEKLEIVQRFERAAAFYPKYIRGLAYLQLGYDEQAVSEFEKILNSRGEAPLSILYPLAKLRKAGILKDAKEYKRFLKFWKDADEDLTILEQTKKEYDNLKK